MSSVDWSSIIEQHTNGKGIFDEKAALDWFKGEVKAQVKKLADEKKAAEDFADNMSSALHQVYAEAGKDVLPRDLLINYALRILNVPITQYQGAYAKVEAYLQGSKDYGVMLGPAGGQVRVKDEAGKETATYKQHKDSIRFGVITRKTTTEPR